MRHPPASVSSPLGSVLLLGSSRAHWALIDHTAQLLAVACVDLQDSVRSPWADHPLLCWAAVGHPGRAATLGLPQTMALDPAAVPLGHCPRGVGIDRRLGAWRAWQQHQGSCLVVDGGTVLSLTAVDGAGRFHGGMLLPGLRLQLQAMADATSLPRLSGLGASLEPIGEGLPAETTTAMQRGVAAGLIGAISAAAQQLQSLQGTHQLVFTGGDGAVLHQLWCNQPDRPLSEAVLWNDLCLEGLAVLSAEQFCRQS